MKIEDYFPTFRNVLLQEVEKEEKTKGGIYIPSSVLNEKPVEEKLYQVIKTGKDCIEIRHNDQVRLMRGLFPEAIEFDGQKFFQVMEQQIIGYFRPAKTDE